MARNSLKGIKQLIERTQDDYPVEKAFLADLKRSIEMSASDTKKPSQTYKPSSMNCIRNMYFQRIGADCDPSNMNYCSVGICNSGSDIHVRIQTAVESMKTNGFDCEYIDVAEFIKSRGLNHLEVVAKSGMETKLFYPALVMSFMCDGIIRYKSHYYILELKTEASFKWNSRTEVDSKHYAQGTAYSIALDLPEVMFMYISRDTLDMKTFLFVPTDDMKQDLIGKITECEDWVNKLICPPMPADLPKRACSYCGYTKICSENK